ncbi:hypothetical protein K469DRAFT_674683 [Zopfia rhizophila CBS 207.26]|uniref:AB hydrolase-1 domain-containing protein n=1 Tax=Zopfia rhizophila CBS 207.26 TaxID=1314779 RepID=A0A6A6DHT4_9PEZI|nr:hypothetical protein K469DRAFT_674683 [Zopfia rhizophila CBS 207.26]
MANPTIAIIAGAATTAEHYGSLRPAFEAKGFPTACVDPPSITVEDATTVTVDHDINFVRDIVLAPLLGEGKDVVLLLHSYGGTYGAAAVNGLSKKERAEKGEKGGVLGLIYAASFCTEPGQSALQALGMSDLLGGIVPGDKPGTLIFSDPKSLWPNLPAEEGALWIGKLKPCSVSAIGTPVSYASYQDPSYKGAIAYVSMEDDQIISKELKQGYLNKSGITLIKSVKGGHGINLEAREEVVGVVLELVDVFVKSWLKDLRSVH